MLLHINFDNDEKPNAEGSVSGVEITQLKMGSESNILLVDGSYSKTANTVAKVVEIGSDSQTRSITIGFSQRFDQSEEFSWEMIRKINKVAEVKNPSSEFKVLWNRTLEEFRKEIAVERREVGYFIS